jgi:hypothetical protein
MTIKQHYKKFLSDALLKCASISDSETRNTIVNDLLTDKINNIKRHSSNRIDVVNIISRCMEYHDGLETLINTIKMFEGDTESMKKVYDLVPLIFDFSSNFSSHRWRELLLLISDIFISEEDLKNFYYKSIPLHVDKISESYSIWNIIKHLSDIPLQNDNTLPLLIFIDQITRSLQDKSLIDPLNQWIENVKTDFTEHSPGIEIKSTPEKPNVNHPIHLLIKLTPELKKQTTLSKLLFKIDVYSWKTSDEIERMDFPETLCSIETAMQEIDNLIVSQCHEDDEIEAIHFFLPCELIHLDVDQWPMKEGRNFESKFGKEYKVLIRLDRQISMKTGKFEKIPPKIIQNLKKKWSKFHYKKISSNSNSIVWVCGLEAYNPRMLFEQFCYSEEAACLILTFLPKEKMDNIGLGHVIRDGAIPAALFLRRSADAIHDHECVKVEMSNIIEGKNFSGLPDLIHKIRIDAQNEDHIGNHLTFIWDDPEKSIPKVYCQSP